MTQDTESRKIDFRPAFHRCTDPKGNFGIGDVRMFWTLTHDGWGITWDVFTNWGLPDAEFHASAPTCLHPAHQLGYPTKLSACGGAVDWHSPVPTHDGQTPSQDDCTVTGGACYLDSGFMLGDELFDLLRTSGGEAVWARLRELLDERRAEVSTTTEAQS